MHRWIIVVVLAAACGGKAKSTADPSTPACCCASGDGREIVAETVCEERGGTCDPTETCEATDPSLDGDGTGGSDPDDY